MASWQVAGGFIMETRMLLNQRVKDLVCRVEQAADPVVFDTRVRALVSELRAACAEPRAVKRYAAARRAPGMIGSYPTDAEGYAVAFDPLTDEESFFECWLRFGIVAGKRVIAPDACSAARARIGEALHVLSGGSFDSARPETWNAVPVDAAGVPVLSRGFFELYHDDMLAQLRQAVRVYVHHVVLWGRCDLWTSFDRVGVKLPSHAESRALPLHVDQNPLVHPEFHTVQGVLALTDCQTEHGTFAGIPGSKRYFSEYARMAQGRGEYVELAGSDRVAAALAVHAQALPLRAGDLISWDSRTTHANTANTSNQIRMVAYIAAGPARPCNARALAARRRAFTTGTGWNAREALMHASKPPRFADAAAFARVRRAESLTLLGKLLYGQASWQRI